MTAQQALIHDPDRSGLWKRVRIGSTVDVDDGAWRHAMAAQQFVGNCRVCGSYLRPGRPYKVGLVLWYPATCIAEHCQQETAGHGPRPAPAPRKRTGG